MVRTCGCHAKGRHKTGCSFASEKPERVDGLVQTAEGMELLIADPPNATGYKHVFVDGHRFRANFVHGGKRIVVTDAEGSSGFESAVKAAVAVAKRLASLHAEETNTMTEYFPIVHP